MYAICCWERCRCSNCTYAMACWWAESARAAIFSLVPCCIAFFSFYIRQNIHYILTLRVKDDRDGACGVAFPRSWSESRLKWHNCRCRWVFWLILRNIRTLIARRIGPWRLPFCMAFWSDRAGLFSSSSVIIMNFYSMLRNILLHRPVESFSSEFRISINSFSERTLWSIGAFACSGFSWPKWISVAKCAILHKSTTGKCDPKKHLPLSIAICDQKHANRTPRPKVGISLVV